MCGSEGGQVGFMTHCIATTWLFDPGQFWATFFLLSPQITTAAVRKVWRLTFNAAVLWFEICLSVCVMSYCASENG